MKAFKHSPLLLSVFTAGALAVSLSGCVYAGNKSWDDLTLQEQADVRQAYQKVREELETAFPDGTPEDELIRDILQRVEQAITAEDGTVQNGQLTPSKGGRQICPAVPYRYLPVADRKRCQPVRDQQHGLVRHLPQVGQKLLFRCLVQGAS